MVSHFLSLGNTRIINRYCHLHPMVRPEVLTEILNYSPRFFRWAGADLFHVTTAHGVRKMVVIETNSCPSGQKSMPFITEHEEQNGYRIMIEKTLKPVIEARTRKEDGELAVVYDKNEMETSGYATTIADVMKERVHLVTFYNRDPEPLVRYRDGWMEVKEGENWIRIRAAFRYVTQKPWNRLPLILKTVILNPVVACLAGYVRALLSHSLSHSLSLSHSRACVIIDSSIHSRVLQRTQQALGRQGVRAVQCRDCRYASQDLYARDHSRRAQGRDSAVDRALWWSRRRQGAVQQRRPGRVHHHQRARAGRFHGRELRLRSVHRAELDR